MPAKNNAVKACYNIQTATDTETHMMVGFDTTNDINMLLSPQRSQKKYTGGKHAITLSDGVG